MSDNGLPNDPPANANGREGIDERESLQQPCPSSSTRKRSRDKTGKKTASSPYNDHHRVGGSEDWRRGSANGCHQQKRQETISTSPAAILSANHMQRDLMPESMTEMTFIPSVDGMAHSADQIRR